MPKKICVYSLFNASCPKNIDPKNCLLMQKLDELKYTMELPAQQNIIYIPTQITFDKKTETGIDAVQLFRDACNECWIKSRQQTK